MHVDSEFIRFAVTLLQNMTAFSCRRQTRGKKYCLAVTKFDQ